MASDRTRQTPLSIRFHAVSLSVLPLSVVFSFHISDLSGTEIYGVRLCKSRGILAEEETGLENLLEMLVVLL